MPFYKDIWLLIGEFAGFMGHCYRCGNPVYDEKCRFKRKNQKYECPLCKQISVYVSSKMINANDLRTADISTGTGITYVASCISCDYVELDV